MRKLKASIAIDNQPCFTVEGEGYKLSKAVEQVVDRAIWILEKPSKNMVEGEKFTFGIQVTFECTMNRRAPRRAPEVIAAEKTARAQKSILKAEEMKKVEEKHRKEQERIFLQRRRRIANQIDYAFKSGSESGSEPVSKYVTCQSCDAPATFLSLGREVPFGSAVLDENTVLGATCSEHTYNNSSYNRHYGIAEYFPVDRLEFFYTGVRQIHIKAARP